MGTELISVEEKLPSFCFALMKLYIEVIFHPYKIKYAQHLFFGGGGLLNSFICNKFNSSFVMTRYESAYWRNERNPHPLSAWIPSFSICLDQVWHIIFQSILLIKRENLLIRGNLSSLYNLNKLIIQNLTY